MMNSKFINKIILGDISDKISLIEDDSIDVIITDPPYFLNKLDNNWNKNKVHSKSNQKVITSLPAGMKFDPKQGKEFYKWFYKISKQFLRVLKPGGFFFSFSSPRLYHRLVSAVDDNGFLIKDTFAWIYTKSQPKAMSLNHFIDKMNLGDNEKERLKTKLKGWKTPQIKSCFEPIMMAQKPYDRTYLNNMIKHNIGLFNTKVKVGNNKFPSNLLTVENINEILDNNFLIEKPTKREKGEYNTHLTVKPIEIIRYLIKLTTFKNKSVILDPFMGSGTTAIAAMETERNFIGIEINEEYIEIAKKRINELETRLKLPLFS